LSSEQALAHGIGEVYSLPVPIHYYLLGSAIAVAISFFLFALFLSKSGNSKATEKRISTPWLPKAIAVVKLATLGLILLIVISGLLGDQQPANNFGPLYFWILFLLGFSVLSALIGNVWQFVSPFASIAEFFHSKEEPKKPPSRIIPWWLPATLLLILFWWELLSGVSFIPMNVGVVLLVYSLLNIYLATFYRDWLLKGELFSVLFNTIGNLAYLRIGKSAKTLIITKPARRIANEAASNTTLLVAIVLLSGASFDSVRETVIWSDLLRSINVSSSQGIQIVNAIGLILTPLIFLGTYLFTMKVMQKLTDNTHSWRVLARRFAWSLIPIAFGYTIAHNFALFITSLPIMLALLSDPFGFGWDIFGSASLASTPLLLSAKTVWFIQISFIVLAHVVGVWFAHVIAMKTFNKGYHVNRSQYPMVILMLMYTIVTLWLIAQVIVA